MTVERKEHNALKKLLVILFNWPTMKRKTKRDAQRSAYCDSWIDAWKSLVVYPFVEGTPFYNQSRAVAF